MNSFNFAQAIQQISIALIPIMLGMMLHEIAHGWVAYKNGDATAKMLGRLSFNPVKHLDPMGTAFFLFTAISSSAAGTPFIFGWAKPVPVNPRNFRNPKFGMIAVSLAGATANLILAFLFTLLFVLVYTYGGIPKEVILAGDSFILNTCKIGIYINCTLAWFNLMPIPPLDGSKVVASLLPPQAAYKYMSIERYGMIIIILLLMLGVLGRIVWPLTAVTVELFLSIVSWFF